MPDAWVVPAVILSVHDGDTITVRVDLGWHLTLEMLHVRLAHINAPELVTPEGKAARDYLAALVPIGSLVTLTSHSLDKYGRTLGTLTLADSRDAGVEMLASGHAVPYEGGPR